jgi:hypothetical protein
MSAKGYKDWVEFLALHGDKIDVVAGDEAEGADFVICRLVTSPLVFPDNLVGHCSKCFRMVQFRPHAPKTPKRICDECAGPVISAAMKDKGFRSFVTENTAADLAAFVRKKGQH